MHECTCHPGYVHDTLVPQVGIITDIREETPDVKTFRVNAPGGGKLFEHMPGQCAMVCVPGVGEAMFSITSSPTNKEYQEFSSSAAVPSPTACIPCRLATRSWSAAPTATISP